MSAGGNGNDTSGGGNDCMKELRQSKKVLKALKKRSSLRKKILIKEWKYSSFNRIRSRLYSRRELEEIDRFKYKLKSANKRRDVAGNGGKTSKGNEVTVNSQDNSLDVYKSSDIFLKGTQSANPHNDYSQHFVDTGQRPQNFIRDTGLNERFQEYPKLKELIRLKDKQIRDGATPPMYLKCDLSSFDLMSLGVKFDVIMIEPPLEEYQRKTSGITYTWKPWDFEEIMNLKIEEISSHRSFVFLWCGSCEGLDLGRECLKKWGFRRCEDICWVKTNSSEPGNTAHLETKSIFQHTKEHCLMGIKGTVRRNQDGHFIHANIDLDIIITEELEFGNTSKPEEIFHIIEHFCLGKRRLHLFGNDTTVRPGWLTLGPAVTSSNFHKETYSNFFEGESNFLLTHSEEIEALRPKTPPPKGRGMPNRGGGTSSIQLNIGRGTNARTIH